MAEINLSVPERCQGQQVATGEDHAVRLTNAARGWTGRWNGLSCREVLFCGKDKVGVVHVQRTQ